MTGHVKPRHSAVSYSDQKGGLLIASQCSTGASKESFKQGVFYALLANVSYAAMQWGLITIIAKRGSLSLLGEYAYTMAIIAPLLTLFSLNLRALLVADYSNNYRFGDYGRLRLMAVACESILFPGLAFLLCRDLGRAIAFMCIALFRSVESLMDMTHGYFQKTQRMGLLCRSMLIRVVFSLTAFFVTMNVRHNLAESFLVLTAVLGGVLIFHDAPLLRRLAEMTAGPIPVQVRLATRSLPLTLGLVLNSFQTNGPRIILKHWSGLEAVGVFSALSYLVVIGGTFVSAVASVASPRVAAYYSNGEMAKLKSLLVKMLLVDTAIGVGLVILFGPLGPIALRFLLSSEIARFANLGVLLAIAAWLSFVESHLGVMVTSMDLLKEQVPIQTIRMLSALGAAFVLIPLGGVRGAIWSLIVSCGLSCLMFYALWRRAFKQRISHLGAGSPAQAVTPVQLS